MPAGVEPHQRAELLGGLRTPEGRVAGGAEEVAGRGLAAVGEDLGETLGTVLAHGVNIGSTQAFPEHVRARVDNGDTAADGSPFARFLAVVLRARQPRRRDER